ncbi:MAG: iron-sulfur cluster insertion protein ErpA [Alphaproteobacteria bacterium]|nr:iron-sulfur cluster insertion protein ErpA [Alphaproteobacteria bacterium]
MSDPFASDTLTAEATFTISETAKKRLREIFSQDENSEQMLRVKVSGGGCAGYQYGFDFESTVSDDDRIFGDDDVKVVIDSVSMDLLGGSQIDFVDDMVGASFQINNPNATASCGCGTSFST